jgi:hypothetical protein
MGSIGRIVDMLEMEESEDDLCERCSRYDSQEGCFCDRVGDLVKRILQP